MGKNKVNSFVKGIFIRRFKLALKWQLQIPLKFGVMMLCLFIAGCYSTRKLVSKSDYQAVNFSTDNLNGDYKNAIGEKTALWNILAGNISFDNDTTVISENAFVRLDLIDEKKLKVELIENDSILKSMLLSGKIKDEYFSIDKKLFIIPIPAIFIYRERKYILGNDKNGDLIVNKGTKDGAWFLVMAADRGGISSLKIKRLEN